VSAVFADLVALHLGGLHPYEKVLTLVLAFGPFIVLGAVIALRRRDEDKDA
jgi:prepilin signal peptidase PulO-like enzyme (type II secretory pathway)